MSVHVSCMSWIVVILITVLLCSKCECYGHGNRITYEPRFMYELNSAESREIQPPELPAWVPMRGDVSGCALNRNGRKRGRKGGVRQRVRRRGCRPPLPMITMANVRSIPNKIDELRGLTRYNCGFRESSLLCFTETWLTSAIPSDAIDIDGYQLIRFDRDQTTTQKTRGGGVCIFMNTSWCRNFTIRSEVCDPNIQLLSVSFRPFYLPREFGQIHILLVYVPPDGDAESASAIISDTVNSLATASPDAPIIALGDFNHCRLENTLPNYQQVVNCATRGNNVLDRCYCSIRDAYKADARHGIGKSDHLAVHLLPKYRQLIKREKVQIKKVKVWDKTASENLQTCFDITDWDLLISSASNLDEAVEIVNGYILFCKDLHINEKEIKVFPNQKPWIRKNLKDLFVQRNRAFSGQVAGELREINLNIQKEIVNAKSKYKEQLESKFRSKNSREAWKCMQTMTGYKKKQKSPPVPESRTAYDMANEFNMFYARFDDKCFDTERSRIVNTLKDLNDTPIVCHYTDVATYFKRTNPRKSMGPDGICGKVLKTCARQLATPFVRLFQESLNQNHVPLCWKSSTIIPAAKTPQASEPNDYRPISLTSLVMKCFERLVLQKYLLPQILPDIDPFQFAYQPHKSVNDAVILLIHLIAQHVDTLGCYVRTTFVDFSSAFNTIQPHLLMNKLTAMNVKPSLILWFNDFLTGRIQRVKLQDVLSEKVTTNTGSPQGCVLSAPLFILYTNDCVSSNDKVSIIKYADDTAIVGMIRNNDENKYREELLMFENWCEVNFLELNTTKTKEMTFDFRLNKNQAYPIKLKGNDIQVVKNLKYLGTVIDNELSWKDQCQSVYAKAQQRLYFLRKMNSFHVDITILRLFYKSIIESVMLFSCVVWYGGCRQEDFRKLQRIANHAGKITKEVTDLKNECTNAILNQVSQILNNPSHPLHSCYTLMRSGKRYRSMRARTSRFLNSFVPLSIRQYNDQIQPK